MGAQCCQVSTPDARPRGNMQSVSAPSGGHSQFRAPPAQKFAVQPIRDYRINYKEKGLVKKQGSVFTVASVEFKSQFVCRKVKMSEMPCQSMEAVNRHLQALSNLEHPHLCKFIEAFEDKGWLYLIYEKANHVTLFEHIRAKSSLTEEEAADYLRQAAMALAVAHSQGVVHGRLSPRSLILADEDMDDDDEIDTQIKICDMGQVFVLRPSVLDHEDSSKLLEVQKYAISPELALRELQTQTDGTLPRGADKSDVWALGVVFYHALRHNTV